MKQLTGFSQWIYEFDVPPNILSQMKEVALSRNYWQNQTNLHTFGPDIASLPEMKPIRKWIDDSLVFLKQDLGLECEEIRTNIEWFNRAERGMWHHTHVHDNSFISGVIYLTPSDAETIFSVPSIWGPEYTILNLISPENSRIFLKYPTNVGKMLVFPAQLKHSVNEHTFDEPRYTMSFNAFPSGFIGSYSDQHYRKFMNITVHQEK